MIGNLTSRILVLVAVVLLAPELLLWAQQGTAAPPRSPGKVTASDHPLDGGDQIDVAWELSPDDPSPQIDQMLAQAHVFEVGQLTPEKQKQVRALLERFVGYRIYRSLTPAEVVTESNEAKRTAEQTAKEGATDELLKQLQVKDIGSLVEEQAARLREARRRAAAEAATRADADAAAQAGQTRWRFVSITAPGIRKLTVDKLRGDSQYLFRVAAIGPGGVASELVATAVAASPAQQWFEGARFWVLVITVILCGAILLWINHARRGHPVKLRKIAALEAVDEAIGRATEMGRPVLFVPGLQDMNDIQTIAGITVLSRVAKTAAEYGAKVEVPTCRSLVMTAARETVEASFLAAGSPDSYNQDLIYYVTDEQFGYVAYLSGMMTREKPAVCFYMGSFFAESLILAEIGNSIGAIQVAGTAQANQFPFFVAACDYTLIGEEFFAASAYLSGSPEEMGSLKGQDVGKFIVAGALLVGILFATLAIAAGSAGLQSVVEFFRGTMLT